MIKMIGKYSYSATNNLMEGIFFNQLIRFRAILIFFQCLVIKLCNKINVINEIINIIIIL